MLYFANIIEIAPYSKARLNELNFLMTSQSPLRILSYNRFCFARQNHMWGWTDLNTVDKMSIFHYRKERKNAYKN